MTKDEKLMLIEAKQTELTALLLLEQEQKQAWQETCAEIKHKKAELTEIISFQTTIA